MSEIAEEEREGEKNVKIQKRVSQRENQRIGYHSKGKSNSLKKNS